MSAQVVISQLPTGLPLTGLEVLPLVQNGITIKASTQDIANLSFGGAVVSSFNTRTGAVSLLSTDVTTALGYTPGSVTSVSGAGTVSGLTLSGSVTTTGSLTLGGTLVITPANFGAQTGNTVLAAPNGATGTPTFRALLAADIPTLNQNTTGTSANVTGIVAVVNGGTGTSTPSLVPGSNILISGNWPNQVITAVSGGGAVTSINTGTGLTGGPITSTGTISIANTTVTAGSYGSASQVGSFTVNAQGQLTAAANVTITASGIGAVTSVAGTANEITASGTTTVVLSLPAALTFTGKTVTGGTFDATSVSVGGVGVVTLTATQTLTNKTLTLPVISQISNTGVVTLPTATDTLVGRATTDTLTNKSISGSTNTLTNIANASLTNSSVTIGTTSIALGASSLTLGGLTSVALTQDPVSALQAATKQYVDTLVSSGITYHMPVKYKVPSGNLNATYNNGASGVGATLTNAGALVAFTPDGTVASVADRILIYNQTNQAQNGVYVVTTVGSGSVAWVLTRASDADTYALKSPNGLGNGDAFFITSGATGAGETYVCNTVGVITFGTTAITFIQISATQIYSAGTGLTLAGTQFSITNTTVTANTYGSASAVPVFAVNAQGQITGVTNTSIAIAASQVTSGTLAVAQGGTNIASYTIGDTLYASGATTLSKLSLGTQGFVMTASATGPVWSGISGGTF